jgi:hypothetical protein
MLTRSHWGDAGQVNCAQRAVYDIGWALGADALTDPPQAIMVALTNIRGCPIHAGVLKMHPYPQILLRPIY